MRLCFDKISDLPKTQELALMDVLHRIGVADGNVLEIEVLVDGKIVVTTDVDALILEFDDDR